MRVFLAGAAGAIGRPLVPLLVEAGHEVTGTTRSPERARAIEAAGATAVVVDALEPDALRAAAEQAEPDVVIHQLTSLPERFNPGKRGVYEATNRIRSEGTRNLLAAARAAGAGRFVCQSVSFAYAPGAQAEVKDEEAPLALDTPGQFGEGARVLDAMERAVLGADGLAGVVLRYGWFYGPGTYCGENGSIATDVRKRRFPIVGRGTGLWSFVHVDDAAAATVIAVERGDPGAYNVVDDEPAAVREWLPAYADAMGAPPPRRIPIWMARLFAGKAAALVDVLPAASNAKARRELGWEPRWRSWRDGFRDAPR
jgi:nucleoside-diphosphate-sugar epimerase